MSLKIKLLQNKFKYLLKSFFTLNKSEQKGIVWILFLIILLLLFNLLMPLFFEKDVNDFSEFKNEISNFRNERNKYADSIALKRKQTKGKLSEKEAVEIINPFKFDPNTLDENGWLKLGFTPKQFKTINNYRSNGGKYKTKQDVKKMYCISDSEYAIIEPFICIEKTSKKNKKYQVERETAPVTNKTKATVSNSKKLFNYCKTELNVADSAQLVLNLNIKPWLAARVVKYRLLLGGFYDKSQMLEVYGFPESYYFKIEDFLFVDTLKLKKLDLNSIEFKQMLKHPYFNYETTKLIFKTKSKSKTKSFTNFYDFQLKTGIADSISQKIRHYLYFGSPK